MDVLTSIAPVFATNCYLVVADDGVSCVVVDVGAGIAAQVRDAVGARGLRPVAVLATHGHVDHTWGAAEVAEAFDVPVRLHAQDAYRLADPFGTLGLGRMGAGSHDPGGPLAQALAVAGIDPAGYRPPGWVETFGTDGPGGAPDHLESLSLDLDGLEFAGAPLAVVHAPGHTEGASVYLIAGAPGPGSVLGFAADEGYLAVGPAHTALTGDVLFAGTIGRTDLPGGDDAVMARTLRQLAAAIPTDTLLLPGHGPATRMDLELRRNRFLAG